MIEDITYYDRTTLSYMSLFLNGFHEFSRCQGYTFQVKRSAPDFLKDEQFSISQSLIDRTGLRDAAGVVLNTTGLFKVKSAGSEFFFCLDAGDHAELVRTDDGVYYGYNLPLLEKVRYYFKANYNSRVINGTPALCKYAHKIVPIPLVYPVAVHNCLSYLPDRFPRCLLPGSGSLGLRRLKELVHLSTMGDLKKHRVRHKDLDTFFVVGYYGDEAHRDENEFRYELIAKLRETTNLNALTGFASRNELPGKYEDFRVDRFSLNQYLKSCARSKVGIYVRGVHQCLSFKLGALLEMGLPIIGQCIVNNEEFFYNQPLFDQQFAYEEPDDMVKNLKKLLADPHRLSEWSASNSSFFDTKLAPNFLVNSVLETIRPLVQ